MAIAGFEPVELLSTLGEPEMRRGQTIRALLYADPSGEYEYYTTEKVREILIKFANSKNAMRRDMPVDEIVDEFMEGGEE
ncbi:hypothetical protein [Weissella sp. MSCH1]|uniref:hypothetical protein n=1 Tax=Weissella sp. MSCH1 TaxID=3383343 RepID=UPI00389683DE